MAALYIGIAGLFLSGLTNGKKNPFVDSKFQSFEVGCPIRREIG
jgi:hypothetical protein